MTRTLPVGLIGQKFMGRAHSNAWGQVARFFDLELTPELRCVAARDSRELARFAERFGWGSWTTDWRELLEDEDLALLDVAAPNDLHAGPSTAALSAGVHVACEKPLARTLDEARGMRDAARRARRRGIHTFVWFNYRRVPAIGLAWNLIREGRLGRIYHVRCNYLQSWGGPDTPRTWRFQRSRAGSGAHGDLNAHLVDLARFLLGEEITEVHGAIERTFVRERPDPERRGKKNMKKSDVDDCVLFLASFRSGAAASFEATRLAAPHQNANSIEIDGEKGSLRFDFEDMNRLLFHDAADGPRTGGWRHVMCTSAGNHPYVENYWPDAHLLGYEHGFVNMAADILRVLAGAEPELPLPDFEDAYQTQRVLEAALISARERRAVKTSEVR